MGKQAETGFVFAITNCLIRPLCLTDSKTHVLFLLSHILIITCILF